MNDREIIRQILMKFMVGAKMRSDEALILLNRGGAKISKSQFEEMRRRNSKGRGIRLDELFVLIDEWKKVQRPDIPIN